MKAMIATAMIAAAVTAAYFAGTQQTTSEVAPATREPIVLHAEPMEVTFANPTAVLLGEAPVPHEALKGTATDASYLIVPELLQK